MLFESRRCTIKEPQGNHKETETAVRFCNICTHRLCYPDVCVQFFLQGLKVDLHKHALANSCRNGILEPELFKLRNQGIERKLLSALSHTLAKNSGPRAGVQRQIPLRSGRQSSASILKDSKSWRTKNWRRCQKHADNLTSCAAWSLFFIHQLMAT